MLRWLREWSQTRTGCEGMIFVVNAENRRLFESDLAEMHRQRKIVFVDRLGWKLPVVTDMEIDRYDCKDTLYLLAKDRPEGEVRASVRLLATEGPHLMSDVFASACHGAAPRGPAIWEVSRFCTAPSMIGRRSRLQALWELTCGVMESALLHGVNQVIFAANRSLLPLTLNCGWDARPLGSTQPDGNDEVTAVVAQISVDALDRVRQRYGVGAPILRLHANESLRSVRIAGASTCDSAPSRRDRAEGWMVRHRRRLGRGREPSHG